MKLMGPTLVFFLNNSFKDDQDVELVQPEREDKGDDDLTVVDESLSTSVMHDQAATSMGAGKRNTGMTTASSASSATTTTQDKARKRPAPSMQPASKKPATSKRRVVSSYISMIL